MIKAELERIHLDCLIEEYRALDDPFGHAIFLFTEDERHSLNLAWSIIDKVLQHAEERVRDHEKDANYR